MTEDVETFGVGGHDAVLDAVVNHFDEVSSAAAATVQIALLGAAGGTVSARRSRRGVDARCERPEDRLEPPDDDFLTADHQAVALVHAPDAATGTDIQVVNAGWTKPFGAAHVVAIVGVTAIDHHIAGLEQLG